MTRVCISCGRDEELRLGVCFDCANSGERRAAHRTVLQHLGKAARNLIRRQPLWMVRYDVTWAWQRLTRTGDYAPGGYFDQHYPEWSA